MLPFVLAQAAADEVEVAVSSESGSPILTIFLFIFVALGALGFYVYNENQKRAETGGAAKKLKKVSKKKLAREARENRSQFSRQYNNTIK